MKGKKGDLKLQSNALFCIIIYIFIILHIILDIHTSYLISLKITMNNTGGLGPSVWGVQFQSLDSPGSADYPLWKVRSPVTPVPFLAQMMFSIEKENSHQLNYVGCKTYNEHVYVQPEMMEEQKPSHLSLNTKHCVCSLQPELGYRNFQRNCLKTNPNSWFRLPIFSLQSPIP